jgi:hypothetical protein
MSLISAAQLLRTGAQIHLERGNSYIQLKNKSLIRKFGATAVWKIPNDKIAKYPGIPRGKQMIFVGFDDLSSGWRLFDPEQRS